MPLQISWHKACPERVKVYDPRDFLGHVTLMLDGDSPRPIREQLDKGYAHGGGWRPIAGFQMRADEKLKFPGDPLMVPLVEVKVLRSNGSLRAHLIAYASAFFTLYEPGVIDDFEVARMD